MDSSIDKEEKDKKEQSLSKLLGMTFEDDGKWTAKDIGATPINRNPNRKERRIARALIRKQKKGK
jgi:hypothetical protein